MNDIKRKRIHGIAIESVAYGSGESTPTFQLDALEFNYQPIIRQADNVSMYGSNYETSDVINDVRLTEFSGTIKVHEDIFPLLMSQEFSISSTTVSGESSVYEHTLTFGPTNNSFTLFVEDSSRGSEYIAGAKFNKIDIKTVRGNYLQVDVAGIGKFPATWGNSVTLAYAYEFASRHMALLWTPEGSGFSGNADVVNATVAHAIELAGDEDNFDLGSEDLDRVVNKQITSMINATLQYPDKTVRNYFRDGDYRNVRLNITDTSRTITGSTQNTNPLIRIDMPSTRIKNFTEEGAANDVLKQTIEIKALDKIGITGAPENMVVRNKTASYAVTP